MAYRVVLVPMTGDPAESHALDVTRSLSDMMRTHIVGLHVREPVGIATPGVMLDPGSLTPGLIEALEESGRSRAAAARQSFQQWCEAAGLKSAAAPPASGGATVEWHETEGRIAHEIARRARTADLTVLARTSGRIDVETDQALQGALIESGRPVLLVPGQHGRHLLETIVIAWNDSRESAHAVAAAWSLIARARRLVIYVGDSDESMRQSADRLASHLAWRGYVAATVVQEAADEVGPALLAAAEREQAGLIIMGAYSHSRLRHFIFGGATSHVLDNSTIPVLMTH